ncbi:flagellar biosynthetic protein FliR [Pseudogemmobacter bohemicus]|uniref:flagellar biosynthetic protein FliR n=1 Tax=Pseudogemmobacter bohemicus TaxID=2250708 RepID=UPI001E403E2F|nr:flagellar biosynthetic protein FliR [Pseudogemmobacter bohemicus]
MTGLIAQLSVIFGIAEPVIWQAGLVFLRVGAAVALLPGFGESFLPQRVKMTAVLVMTAIVLPAVLEAPLPGTRLQGMTFTPGSAGVEVLAGLLLGFTLRLMILCLQIAGTMIGQSVSLAQMFNGTGPEPQPIVSNLLTLGGLVLFCTMGGLVRSVELLVYSYDILPPGQLPDPGEISRWALGLSARAFALAFTLSAPFILAALLYNLALGAINRAMPSLMVTFIGAPALTLGGLILLALASPFLLQSWQDALAGRLLDPFGAW